MLCCYFFTIIVIEWIHSSAHTLNNNPYIYIEAGRQRPPHSEARARKRIFVWMHGIWIELHYIFIVHRTQHNLKKWNCAEWKENKNELYTDRLFICHIQYNMYTKHKHINNNDVIYMCARLKRRQLFYHLIFQPYESFILLSVCRWSAAVLIEVVTNFFLLLNIIY